MNMSYCRFQNTLADLRECWEALVCDPPTSPEEVAAAVRLLDLCKQMATLPDPLDADEE